MTPIPTLTEDTLFVSWRRESTRAFASWSCAPVAPRILTGGGGLGRAVGNYYHTILPEMRRPYALLWRDVRTVLLPGAAGRLNCGEAFAAAALDALDTLITQQGFRDVAFMAEVQEQVGDGDRQDLLALLPRSRQILREVSYRLVHGPHRSCWEGYTAAELSTCIR